MKTKQELQDKINELIAFADAETPQEHANLGALLVSAGACFMKNGGVSIEGINYCVEQGIRASSGLVPLPLPGDQIH